MPTPITSRLLLNIAEKCFPDQCLFCGKPDEPACSPCLAGLPWLEHCCQRCALPLGHGAELCPHCLKAPPAFRHCLCLWRYEFPISTLIQRFKYQADRPARRFLETQLSRTVDMYLEQSGETFDAVLAVPSHPLKRFWRGYNQSYLLAKALSRTCQLPYRSTLAKRRWSRSQQGLSRKQRLNNLKTSFQIRSTVAGLKLLLVDDVMTTASTANVISQLLMEHDATSVDIACLARTPQHMTS
ncbi:ComF family protein [Pseudoteredinibacter isoporae]|uniref:ComF family protein n=1 Tax=Pseudoteredinibacter isoporae TaxID=570281 RepID=UPI00333EF30B